MINLYVDKINVDGVLETTLKQVLCIEYFTTFSENFMLTQKVRSISYILSLLKSWVFGSKKTFLVANDSLKIVLKMLFLTFSNLDIDFIGWEHWLRTYIIQEALPTTRYVELIEKKGFATAVLDLEYKTFVVHIVSLSSTPLIDADVHLSYKY